MYENAKWIVFRIILWFKNKTNGDKEWSDVTAAGETILWSCAGPPPFGSSWVKRYCTFVKEQKILHMVTYDPKSFGKIVSDDRFDAPRCLSRPRVLIYRVESSHSCVITSWAGVFTWWHPWMKSCVFVLSGWKRICHTQILREENDRHPGPPVLPGDRDHRPVGQTLQAGIPTSGSVFRTERIRIWISVPSVMRFK